MNFMAMKCFYENVRKYSKMFDEIRKYSKKFGIKKRCLWNGNAL